MCVHGSPSAFAIACHRSSRTPLPRYRFARVPSSASAIAPRWQRAAARGTPSRRHPRWGPAAPSRRREQGRWVCRGNYASDGAVSFGGFWRAVVTIDRRKRPFAAASVLSLAVSPSVLGTHGRDSENSRQTHTRPSGGAGAIALTASTHTAVLQRDPVRSTASAPSTAPTTGREREAKRAPAVTPREARRARAAARAFLDGYLPYSYGRVDADRIRGAAPPLLRALHDAPPRVPAAVARARPRLVSLRPEAATGDRDVLIVAAVDDGRRRYDVPAHGAPRRRSLGRDRDQRLSRVSGSPPSRRAEARGRRDRRVGHPRHRSRPARGHPDGRSGAARLWADCQLHAVGGRPRRHPRQLPRLDPRRSASLRPRLDRHRRDLLDRERLRPARRPGRPLGENFAGAGGPGQFLAATWERYGVDGDGDGVKDRYDPADAIPGTANLLRQNGAPGDYGRAIFAYNHASWYVDDVLSRAARYRGAARDNPSAARELRRGRRRHADSRRARAQPQGPADLDTAVRLTSPAAYRALPAWAMAGGRPARARRRPDLRRRALGPAPLRPSRLRGARDRPPHPRRRHRRGSRARGRRDARPTGTRPPGALRASSAGRRLRQLRRPPGLRAQAGHPVHRLRRLPQPRLAADLHGRMPRPYPRVLGLRLLRLERARAPCAWVMAFPVPADGGGRQVWAGSGRRRRGHIARRPRRSRVS